MPFRLIPPTSLSSAAQGTNTRPRSRSRPRFVRLRHRHDAAHSAYHVFECDHARIDLDPTLFSVPSLYGIFQHDRTLDPCVERSLFRISLDLATDPPVFAPIGFSCRQIDPEDERTATCRVVSSRLSHALPGTIPSVCRDDFWIGARAADQ